MAAYNGRKITFISYDDGYSPPKTVEQARRLVESDEVFLIFAPLGTATNAAIQKYMNTMRVPQLFVLSGASRWGDPSAFSLDDWLAAQLPRRKRGSMPRIFLSNTPTLKSASSIRTMISEGTTYWD